VLGYFLSPHSPWVYGANGEPLSGSKYDWTKLPNSENRKLHADQSIYMAKKLVELVENIIENSKTPPIILIQSDHGVPFHEGWQGDLRNDPSGEMFWEAHAILNGYLVPPEVRTHLYDTITPVNSFRVLFREYFGLDYPKLEDRVFFNDYFDSKPKDFVDVTETVHQFPPFRLTIRQNSDALVN